MQLQSCPREWERGTSGGEDGWDRMRCHAPSDFFSLCPSSATCKSQTLLPKRELRGKGEEKEKKKGWRKKTYSELVIETQLPNLNQYMANSRRNRSCHTMV
jgi:hypothetical protein